MYINHVHVLYVHVFIYVHLMCCVYIRINITIYCTSRLMRSTCDYLCLTSYNTSTVCVYTCVDAIAGVEKWKWPVQ